jgi:hypothetical protein
VPVPVVSSMSNARPPAQSVRPDVGAPVSWHGDLDELEIDGSILAGRVRDFEGDLLPLAQH